MKPRHFISLALFLFAASASAQDATLVTPVTRPSEFKHTVSPSKGFSVSQFGAVINMEVRASDNVVIREYQIELPEATQPAATIPAFFTAMQTVIAGETGGVMRRTNARIVKFLADNSLLPPVVVNP